MVQTVLGKVSPDELGIVLPHEHILVGFIPEGKMGPEDYDRAEVVQAMLPRLLDLKAAGCSTLAECTPEFLGRDPVLLETLSRLSGLHILTNTGFYQAPYLASFVYDLDARGLADIWVKEAREGIGGSGIMPGFIKIALSNGGPVPPVQQTILEAALLTSRETGLVIQAHTIGGEAAMQALSIMKAQDFDPHRFIWVHADSEKDLAFHQKAAEAGMWIEVDSISWRPLEEHAFIVAGLLGLGLADHLLLSQDAGWYHVGEPGGGDIKPFTPLLNDFIPLLKEQGIKQAVIDKLLTKNPARALDIKQE